MFFKVGSAATIKLFPKMNILRDLLCASFQESLQFFFGFFIFKFKIPLSGSKILILLALSRSQASMIPRTFDRSWWLEWQVFRFKKSFATWYVHVFVLCSLLRVFLRPIRLLSICQWIMIQIVCFLSFLRN